MCLHPKKILNPTRLYYRDLTKRDIYVPCGKCDDCINQKTDEWLIRLQYELSAYLVSGGRVLFPTLTYNNKHVPKYYYYDDEGSEHDVLVFNPKHKDRFIKRLRRYFERAGLRVKRTVNGVTNDYNSELGIRYMIASEFGSDTAYVDSHGKLRHGTFRPHYHILLFFPKWIIDRYSAEELHHILQACWTEQGTNIQDFRVKSDKIAYKFTDNEQLGEVRWSVDDKTNMVKMFVDNDYAIRYCAKYMAKDINFKQNIHIKCLLRYLRKKSLGMYDTIEKADEYYNKVVNTIMPRHFQSTNLGHMIIDTITNHPECLIDGIDLTQEKLFHNHLQVDKHGKAYKYPVPRCLKEKVCYNHDTVAIDGQGKPVVKRNIKNKYYEVMLSNFNKRLSREELRLRLMLFNNWSDTVDKLPKEVNDLKLNLGCLSSYDVLKEIINLFQNDLDLYLLYNKFARGKVVEKQLFDFLIELDKNQMIEYLKSNFLLLDKKITPDDMYIQFKKVGWFKGNEHNPKFKSRYTFMNHVSKNCIIPLDGLPIFENLSILCDIINKIDSYVKQQRIRTYFEKRELTSLSRKYKATTNKRNAKLQSWQFAQK